MSETLDRLPARIRVTNETGEPSNTDIFDAETGAHVDGVMEVHLSRREIVVVATLTWPVEPTGYVLNTPGYDGPSIDGVKTATRTYNVKRLELESW